MANQPEVRYVVNNTSAQSKGDMSANAELGEDIWWTESPIAGLASVRRISFDRPSRVFGVHRSVSWPPDTSRDASEAQRLTAAGRWRAYIEVEVPEPGEPVVVDRIVTDHPIVQSRFEPPQRWPGNRQGGRDDAASRDYGEENDVT